MQMCDSGFKDESRKCTEWTKGGEEPKGLNEACEGLKEDYSPLEDTMKKTSKRNSQNRKSNRSGKGIAATHNSVFKACEDELTIKAGAECPDWITLIENTQDDPVSKEHGGKLKKQKTTELETEMTPEGSTSEMNRTVLEDSDGATSPIFQDPRLIEVIVGLKNELTLKNLEIAGLRTQLESFNDLQTRVHTFEEFPDDFPSFVPPSPPPSPPPPAPPSAPPS